MLELTYSNRTEALLERLAERVREARTEHGPWETIHIVVPNPYLKEYLRLGLARQMGIAANFHFSYLAGLWKDLLVDGTQRILDFDLLRAGLLRVLGDRELLSQDELKPVRDYLGPEGVSLKRVQLARELAKVFEEYQLSRPDWIEAWRAGTCGKGADPIAEAWQSRLWRDVVQTLDASPSTEHPIAHVTLLELIRKSSFEGMKLPRAIHAFGLSHVAQAYQEIYQAFGSLSDTTLHIYALNPCCEFWEDVSSDRQALKSDLPDRDKARRGPWDEETEDFYELASQGPRALRLWGRPGRENIRLLNEVSECNFDPEFDIPLQPTLLGQMQRDILLFQEPGEGESGEGGGVKPDSSIRCLACPSPRREAEIVATEIWRLMAAHGQSENPLRFSDIAVVVPPGAQEAYRVHLQAAFHDTRRIPMVQSDRALPVMRQTLEAVQRLLELPTSDLTRSALLAVLQHPGLQRRFPELDTSAWARWCEEFGIVRGADQAAWAGTYLDRDVLNWDQGLKRLALGAFMTEDTEFQQGGESYLVNGARDEVPAATFTTLVRGLCTDAQHLLQAKDEPRIWIQNIWHYLAKWLEVDEGDEAEAILKSLDRIRTFLERMFEKVPENLDMPAIDFIAARHLALEALERLQDEQPANLSKGVVIATYATMRAIPFRAIFLMGMGEGSFPTRNTRSALDLRAKGRRPGDVSQTEKEKYLFLEMLMSARDHLVFSYVAVDELSGEAFEPSGLFKEFRSLLGDYLAREWTPTDKSDPFLEAHPLRRFDPTYFPEWFPKDAPTAALQSYSPIAEAEAQALWLGADARNHQIIMPRSLGELDLEAQDLKRLRAALDTPEVPALGTETAPAVPPCDIDVASGPAPDTTWGSKGGRSERSSQAVPPCDIVRLSLYDLKTFLECPLSGAAAVRLGLRKRELEDRASMEDELFESEFLDSWSLQREVTLGALRSGDSAEHVFDQHLRRLQDAGGAPFGVFAEVERGKNLKPIEAWVGYLRDRSALSPVTWRLGTNRSGTDQVDKPLPPLAFTITLGGQTLCPGSARTQSGGQRGGVASEASRRSPLAGQTRRVELSGDLRVQLEGSLYLETGKPPSESERSKIQKKALGAYLDHLVLTCVDPTHAEHRARFVFESSKKAKGEAESRQEDGFLFPALTREEAEAQLRTWIEDLLTGNHAVLLPIEAVLDGWGNNDLTADSILAFVDKALEEENSYLSTLRGPVPDPTRYAPPPDPEAIVEARLGAFLKVVCPRDVQEQN